MEKRSRELLQLEHNNPSSSAEGGLLICGKLQQQKPKPVDGKPFTEPLPKSLVLDRVKGFLGVLSEANKNLQLNAEGKDYNIEALNGDESEIIEMDLMLGVADLNTPEAVAAAEATIAGKQGIINLQTESSSSESESSSDDDDDDDDDEGKDDDEDMKDSSSTRQESEKEEGSLKEQSKITSKTKQPKIVELS